MTQRYKRLMDIVYMFTCQSLVFDNIRFPASFNIFSFDLFPFKLPTFVFAAFCRNLLVFVSLWWYRPFKRRAIALIRTDLLNPFWFDNIGLLLLLYLLNNLRFKTDFDHCIFFVDFALCVWLFDLLLYCIK